ncbi:hypothetical protein HDZ31DRAFT_78192 [Schizophyllum fasciatum]
MSPAELSPSLFMVIAQPLDCGEMLVISAEEDRRRKLVGNSKSGLAAAGDMCDITIDTALYMVKFYEIAVAHNELLCKHHRLIRQYAIRCLLAADADIKSAKKSVREALASVYEQVLEFVGRERDSNGMNIVPIRSDVKPIHAAGRKRTHYSSLHNAILQGDKGVVERHLNSIAAYAHLSANHADPQSGRSVTGIWQSFNTDVADSRKQRNYAEAGQGNRHNGDEDDDGETPLRRTRSMTAKARRSHASPVDTATLQASVCAPGQRAEQENIGSLRARINDLRERSRLAVECLKERDADFQFRLYKQNITVNAKLVSHGIKYASLLAKIHDRTLAIAVQKSIGIPGLDLATVVLRQSSSVATTADVYVDDAIDAVIAPTGPSVSARQLSKATGVSSKKRNREQDDTLTLKPTKKRR